MKKRLNIYTCPDGHVTVTIDRDHGVTPFMISCNHFSIKTFCSCDKDATSSFYRCNPELEPTHEWYKPAPGQKLDRYEKEHCDQGGLLLRKIGEEPAKCAHPIVKLPGRNDGCYCGSGKKFKKCCINKVLHAPAN